MTALQKEIRLRDKLVKVWRIARHYEEVFESHCQAYDLPSLKEACGEVREAMNELEE